MLYSLIGNKGRFRLVWAGVLILAFCASPCFAVGQTASKVTQGSAGAPTSMTSGMASNATSIADPAISQISSLVPAAPAASDLPDSLTILGMYHHADWVVKSVLIGLVIASIVNWIILLAKAFELLVVRRQQLATLRSVKQSGSISAISQLISKRQSASAYSTAMIEAMLDEMCLSSNALADTDGIKERVALRFERIEAASERKIMKGTGILATIGASAPFVGLFGTVWGIMHSFIGISESQTTNLAVVAPGIAEALLATACGLVAAIPAVIIYNYFIRRIAEYKALNADTASALLGLLSRDLSHGTTDVSYLKALME